MKVAEEKIKIIEKVLETDDVYLLREIASLLHTPSLTDYPSQLISHEAFLAKIERSEEEARKSEVIDHEQVKKIITMWNSK